MNEEKYIEEKVGRRNPFVVPEGYFDTFADQMMASLPERQPQVKRLWLRQAPLAAPVALCRCCGVYLSVGCFGLVRLVACFPAASAG